MKIEKTEIGGYTITVMFVADNEGEAVAMLDAFQADSKCLNVSVTSIKPQTRYNYERLLKMMHSSKENILKENVDDGE